MADSLIYCRLLAFHTKSQSRAGLLQSGLSSNQQTSVRLLLRFHPSQGQVTVCLQNKYLSPMYTTTSLPHPWVVKRETMPLLMSFSTCPRRGKGEGWISQFGLVVGGPALKCKISLLRVLCFRASASLRLEKNKVNERDRQVERDFSCI